MSLHVCTFFYVFTTHIIPIIIMTENDACITLLHFTAIYTILNQNTKTDYKSGSFTKINFVLTQTKQQLWINRKVQT